MKILQILILIIFTPYFLISQTDNSDSYVNPDEEYVVPFDSLSIKDKLHYNFQMGVTASSNGSFGTFYRPSLVYQVSPKLSISTGFMYQNIQANNLPILNDFQYQSFSGNIAQYYAFVAGKYKLNERWAVGGSVFYDFTQFNDVNGSNLNQNTSGFNRVGYSGFFEYKTPSGFVISGEIRVNDQYNPFNRYGNGFNTSFGTGFDRSFGSPFQTW